MKSHGVTKCLFSKKEQKLWVQEPLNWIYIRQYIFLNCVLVSRCCKSDVKNILKQKAKMKKRTNATHTCWCALQIIKHLERMGSGCGSDGRVVATSESRCPRFESSHRENLYRVFTLNCVEKAKIKKKRGREWPFFRKEGNFFKDCIKHHIFNNSRHTKCTRRRCSTTSVTRLGNLLDFGELFKAFGNK